MLVIGRGLRVAPSTLGETAGLGLFVTQDVTKGMKFTVYDGELICKDLAPSVDFETVTNMAINHSTRIMGSEFTVIGLVDPMLGFGGGSFACSSDKAPNARIIKVSSSTVPNHTYFGVATDASGALACTETLVLEAIVDIPCGAEVFIKFSAESALRRALVAKGRLLDVPDHCHDGHQSNPLADTTNSAPELPPPAPSTAPPASGAAHGAPQQPDSMPLAPVSGPMADNRQSTETSLRPDHAATSGQEYSQTHGGVSPSDKDASDAPPQ